VAIKTVDPTALVSGPVIDYWWNYFYSKKDMRSGWGAGPCYEPWQNPADRKAHGGAPMIEYYLQQFKAAQATYGMRLLDYVGYPWILCAGLSGGEREFGGPGAGGRQRGAAGTAELDAGAVGSDLHGCELPAAELTRRIRITRSSCSTPLQAPQVVPMLESWVTSSYPGTKTAIDEYNFGGLEALNGALTQADVLGIFGAYGWTWRRCGRRRRGRIRGRQSGVCCLSEL